MREGFDIAQVCPNGHVINSMSVSHPNSNQDHCEHCGERTIAACAGCSSPIRGYYHSPGVIGFFEYAPPGYCHKCGSAFPWTERRLKAAQDVAIEVGGLEGEDAQSFEAIEPRGI